MPGARLSTRGCHYPAEESSAESSGTVSDAAPRTSPMIIQWTRPPSANAARGCVSETISETEATPSPHKAIETRRLAKIINSRRVTNHRPIHGIKPTIPNLTKILQEVIMGSGYTHIGSESACPRSAPRPTPVITPKRVELYATRSVESNHFSRSSRLLEDDCALSPRPERTRPTIVTVQHLHPVARATAEERRTARRRALRL